MDNMNKKYEKFTNNELALLNKVIGYQAKEMDDVRLFWMWHEISKELDWRELNLSEK